MLKFEPKNRPFNSVDEMNEALIQKWNNKVKPGDEVYILGDFCFDNYGDRATIFLKRLNGNKYLIKGNHDSFIGKPQFDKSQVEYIKVYDEVDDYVNGKKVHVCLFHYPIAVWNRKHNHAYHLFGHIHSNSSDGCHHALEFDLGDHAFNVGVDVRDLEPKTLQELVDSKKRGY
jgi:calcineurin-like phosphoesterase family protein